MKINDIRRHFTESSHVYRQISATFASSLLSLSGGITFGFTAVLLPQLENDKSFPYDKSYDSWIASISPLAMMMGSLFSGSMSDGIGRKMGQIVIILPFTIGWVIMGLSTNNTLMLIGRFVTGISTGAVRANTMVYIGELSDPKYRPVTLFCPSLAIHVGSFISHTVGKYVYWKTSCFLFVIPNFITLSILLFLKESPLWLLTKGRIDEGVKSFRLFRGNGDRSEKELTAVLKKCQEKANESSFRDNMKIIISVPFLKSIATIFMLFMAVQWSGVVTLSFYAQDIYERTFHGDIDAYLLVLATDCIKVAAAVTVCIFAVKLRQSITFVSCCFTVSILLTVFIIYLYFKPVGLVWLAVTCMILYLAVASSLPCISWSVVAEIFPSKVRGFGSGLSSAISFGLLFISVKVTPQILVNFGEMVMYGTFAVVTLICGTALIFILPETKGKSLQQIEDNLYQNENKVNVINNDEVRMSYNHQDQIVVKL